MRIIILVGAFGLVQTGCQEEKNADKPGTPTIIYRTDTSKPTANKAKKPPIINISDTVTLKQLVLVMKDSSGSSEGIGLKLNHIYDKVLAELIQKNNISKTGSRMAWFKSSSAPFFFEAGFPVNKKPAKLPRNIQVKTIGGDSAVIAHFYGPYELTYEGYGVLKDWLKEHKKKAAGAPYEVYIGEPVDAKGLPRDPYRVQTDIIFPYH